MNVLDLSCELVGGISVVAVAAWIAHYFSYHVIKLGTLKERRWDYNICCGTTDGGGINADIVRHADVPRYEQVSDVTRLPHPDKAFGNVLCSHTIEHVPDPKAMFRELQRVGKNVTLLIPPLWDFTAAFHPLEHQVIFLTFKSRHDNALPVYVRYWPARWLQAMIGQRIEAEGSWHAEGNRGRVIADRLLPFCFGATAVTCLLKQPIGLAFFILSLAVLWFSKRTPKQVGASAKQESPVSESRRPT